MTPLIYLLIALVLLIVFLSIKLQVEKKRRENTEERLLMTMFGHDKISARLEFLTRNEQRFYRDLENKFGKLYHIFSQVSLRTLLAVKEDWKNLQEKQSLMDKFYFDFVLCSKDCFKPLLVIELNDKPHRRQRRKESDAYFAKALESANVKFLSLESNYLTYDHYMEEVGKILPSPPTTSSY